MGDGPSRRRKPDRVRRNSSGLDDILLVLLFRVAPAADFKIHLTQKAADEDRCGFQVRNVTRDKPVRTVSQASGEVYLGTHPLVATLRDSKMQRSVLIRPGIGGIVQVDR